MILPMIIKDLNMFKNIYEIPLLNNPNYAFSTTLNNYIFNINIRTFQYGTRISIEANNNPIVINGNLKAFLNLNYFSNFTDGIFFFYTNYFNLNFNYQNLNNELKLNYGTI